MKASFTPPSLGQGSPFVPNPTFLTLALRYDYSKTPRTSNRGFCCSELGYCQTCMAWMPDMSFCFSISFIHCICCPFRVARLFVGVPDGIEHICYEMLQPFGVPLSELRILTIWSHTWIEKAIFCFVCSTPPPFSLASSLLGGCYCSARPHIVQPHSFLRLCISCLFEGDIEKK